MNIKEAALVSKLLAHIRTDMSYGAEGTFGNGEGVDEVEIKRAEKAIEIIKRLVIRAQKS